LAASTGEKLAARLECARLFATPIRVSSVQDLGSCLNSVLLALEIKLDGFRDFLEGFLGNGICDLAALPFYLFLGEWSPATVTGRTDHVIQGLDFHGYTKFVASALRTDNRNCAHANTP
jgi:hypothetical protein